MRDTYLHPQFQTDVIKPLQIDMLYDNEVLNLSGGGWVGGWRFTLLSTVDLETEPGSHAS